METNDKAATLWLIFVLIIRADSYPPKILFYARFKYQYQLRNYSIFKDRNRRLNNYKVDLNELL